MARNTIIVWFRQDLRVYDHPALAKAAAEGDAVIPLYIFDDTSAEPWAMGPASRWWLHHSLTALSRDLADLGTPLVVLQGEAREVLPAFCKTVEASAVFTSRMYEPWSAALEKELHSALQTNGTELRRFVGTLLKEPEDVATLSGGSYKVFTPFWRSVSTGGAQRRPIAKPKALPPAKGLPKSANLTDLDLLPTIPDWSGGLQEAWTPGEAGARKRLKSFLAGAIVGYQDQRNRPDVVGTSRLSPHLHFGEVSPATVWQATISGRDAGLHDRDHETFLKELVWREFSAHLLFHFPSLPDAPFRREFSNFPWRASSKALGAWQRGQTGYPIVDAGMRELWGTGWMHNRVRMIVASFLIKDLLVDWRDGEAWFWDTLVDADLASNAAGWQWVAGSGADAAPYFRIFNPVTQGQKFDPDGAYVRKWVPEIARLPKKFLHAPWTAPPEILKEANVMLGKTYPKPIVDHAKARNDALAGYNKVKSARAASAAN